MAGEKGWYVLPGIELASVHDLAVVVVDEIKMEGLGKNGNGDGDKYEGRDYAEECQTAFASCMELRIIQD